MLHLATHKVHYLATITSLRELPRDVTSGEAHLRGFAPGQHSFEVRRNIAAMATLSPLRPAQETNPRLTAPRAMSLPTEPTGRHTTNLVQQKYVYQ